MIDENDTDTESLPLDMPQETAVNKLQRDPVTGQFLPGNKGGGRPKGAKDKVSQKLVGLMTELMDRRGEELIERIADDDPAAALAILTRIVPQAELQRIFLDGDEAEKLGNTDITIRLVQQVQENQALTNDAPRLVEGELVEEEHVTH